VIKGITTKEVMRTEVTTNRTEFRTTKAGNITIMIGKTIIIMAITINLKINITRKKIIMHKGSSNSQSNR
jgi:hypothetical protein